MTSPSPTSQPAIDFVFTWCDGADPEFIRRKNDRLHSAGAQAGTEDNIGAVRYREHGELRYALRSVYQYAPWFSHIYLVTDRQKPAWLKEHSKISVIDHSEIIPRELLPTFSSVCIEMYLDRIPGLSKKFIYGNDDTMIGRPLSPSDFFPGGGRPVVWLNEGTGPEADRAFAQKLLNDPSRRSWRGTVLRAWRLFEEKKTMRVPLYYPGHSFDAYTIGLFRDVLSKHPELLTANAAPFRTGKEISRVLFSYEMAFTFGCPKMTFGRFTALEKLKNRLLRGTVPVVCRNDLYKLERDVSILRPETFCLNNLTDDSAAEALRYCQSLFPAPAPWEKAP